MRSVFRHIFLGTLFLCPTALFSQILNPHDEQGYHCSAYVLNGDTIPVMYYDEVYVWGKILFKNSAEARKWNRLVYNVKRAYPYAKLAGIKFKEYNDELAVLKNEKQKKELMKKVESELQAQFGDELKQLTTTQGHILLKLVDRETGNTSYDIVKEFRGWFRAFFWQSFARIFGFNLKDRYDPLNADADIERIVLMIERGTI